MQVREQEGRFQGPAFCNTRGEIAPSKLYEEALVEHLEIIQARRLGLIPADIKISEDFGISRSF